MFELFRQLKAARERAHLSQEDLAEKLGKHPVSISRWETGDRVPSLSDLCKIGDALGVKVAWFFLEDGCEIVNTAESLDQKKALALIRQGLDFLEATHSEPERPTETAGPSPDSVALGGEDKSSNDSSVGFGRGARKLSKGGSEPASDIGG